MIASTNKLAHLVAVTTLLFCAEVRGDADPEDQYYKIVSIFTPTSQTASRSVTWKPAPKGLALEVSGMCVLKDQRVAVAIRKGEIWILGGVFDDPPDDVTYQRFASGLHDPLGLLWHGDSFYTVQRSEMTRIRDVDGDGIADQYRAVAKGWGVSGHYHEYAYGPKLDGSGNLWLTLNIGLGLKGDQLNYVVPDAPLGFKQGLWRGWGMKLTPEGRLIPMCAGMRSPSGLGANREGDMFYTDQQGNWVGTNSLHHMRRGALFHHVEALASMNHPESPIRGIETIPARLPVPEAVRRLPQLKPPAVWFPYKKMGQSTTDIMLDDSGGKFGPFDGQLFIGEFTQSSLSRVFLEKVDGEYQGACFPFRERFASAVFRMAQGGDGSVLVGLTNRGWSSLGDSPYGLQRLVWTGKTPFEIQEMRASSDGFDLVFTKPVDVDSATKRGSYAMSSYTYTYHSSYGSPEILTKSLEIKNTALSNDRRTVHLKVAGLRELFVHELVAAGVRSAEGEPLLHNRAYYTLNRIPE